MRVYPVLVVVVKRFKQGYLGFFGILELGLPHVLFFGRLVERLYTAVLLWRVDVDVFQPCPKRADRSSELHAGQLVRSGLRATTTLVTDMIVACFVTRVSNTNPRRCLKASMTLKA